MIDKRFVMVDGKQVARVTFTVPASLWASALYLVGDFNDWNKTSHLFECNQVDGWTITVDLEVGHAFQFRYWCEGDRWLNDSHADAYVVNSYGSDNFVVVTDPSFKQYCD